MNALATRPRAQWRLRCEGYGRRRHVCARWGPPHCNRAGLGRTAVADIGRLTELLAKTSIRTASAGANRQASVHEVVAIGQASGCSSSASKPSLAGTGGASHGASDPTAAGSPARCHVPPARWKLCFYRMQARSCLWGPAQTRISLSSPHTQQYHHAECLDVETPGYTCDPRRRYRSFRSPSAPLAQVRTELVNALITSCACPLASGAPD